MLYKNFWRVRLGRKCRSYKVLRCFHITELPASREFCDVMRVNCIYLSNHFYGINALSKSSLQIPAFGSYTPKPEANSQ